jgi:MFS family permease
VLRTVAPFVPRRIVRGREAIARPVVLLACVLALDGADLGTVGAIASQLERSLRITNTQIGLLASVVSLAAALATVPIGALSDRVSRVRLLAGSIALWSAAMVAAGAASSYSMLLLARVFLGAVQATSGPTLVSLIGDLFPAVERGRINGYILSGELLGGGVGFLVSGEVAALLGWRWAFWILVLPSVALVIALLKLLPEPARGRQSRLIEEQAAPGEDGSSGGGGLASMGIGRAIRYVLSVRTNVVVMIASALGYFFMGGVRTFALIFVRGHFHLGQAGATAIVAAVGAGAIAGVLVGGRVSDRMIRRRIDARMIVGGSAYVLATLFFLPGLLIKSVALAVPLLVLGGAMLGAPNPPLDAARLDVMPAPLWGRAEGVRTFARTLAVGIAPLLFGWIADLIARPNTHDLRAIGATATNGHALAVTFIVMLVPVAASGLVLLRGRKHYARDIRTSSGPRGGARSARSGRGGVPSGAVARGEVRPDRTRARSASRS